jgi:hypothetical protein
MVPPPVAAAPAMPMDPTVADEPTVIVAAPTAPPVERSGPVPRPATPTPPAGSPSRPSAASSPVPVTPKAPVAVPPAKARAGLPVGAWIAGLGTAVAKVRTLPRTQLLIAGGVLAVLLLAAVVWALTVIVGPGTAPPASGTVVIEAVPWAHVTAIKDAEGNNQLAAPAATPFSTSLPAGTYTVELRGPDPANEVRTVTVEVKGDGITVAPSSKFGTPTGEEYFNQYFGGDVPAVPPAGDGTGDAGAAPAGEGATQPPPPAPTGVVP